MDHEDLSLKKLCAADLAAFRDGVADRDLKRMYGLGPDMDDEAVAAVFGRFCRLERSYSIRDKKDRMIGFVLDVAPELPEPILSSLRGHGRTLAFAVFPAYQRRGCMEKTLRMYTERLFTELGADYVHCGCFDFNAASRNLLNKVGFAPLGERPVKNACIVDMILRKPDA